LDEDFTASSDDESKKIVQSQEKRTMEDSGPEPKLSHRSLP
jgi:hypothetical protein